MNWTLYHHPLCPFSRKIRIILREKNIEFSMVVEKYWERRREFLYLSPSGMPPALYNSETKEIYNGNFSLVEFLETINGNILPSNIFDAYKTRNIAEWFDIKFYNEVTRYLLEEKIMKQLASASQSSPPNSSAIRAAKKNIITHLDYIAYLLKNGQDYLNGERAGLADFTAAAHLSILDYIGDVPWEYNNAVKNWYALIKSRPSFRPLLNDEVAGLYRAPNYQNLDF